MNNISEIALNIIFRKYVSESHGLKKFLWKDRRGDREEKNGKDESAKTSKC